MLAMKVVATLVSDNILVSGHPVRAQMDQTLTQDQLAQGRALSHPYEHLPRVHKFRVPEPEP